MKNNTLIIIPAYNEELTIGSVVTLAKKFGDVLVVDDGPFDKTSQGPFFSPRSKTWRFVNE
ncbi:hypothetical protein [Thermococcus argininiproducens]|uniref:hypothetical protein n=1 Tax=Thermococcus argininiproducens TaxID=2866384 RepID=UPI00207465D8|nr:hypothetical protein [Thermococcus argininiproducens]